ncbi:hypothetical protein FB451DRAFT_1482765 [Mycena latifolia]|nr:hypothetical protein FB451DRAFT_1482765 [Mycena latifolia]
MPRAEMEISAAAIRIATMLQSSLRDPMNTNSLCAQAIQTAAASDLMTLDRPDVMAKDPHQTPILRAIMHFLTCHRSEQEQVALIQKLATCCCNFRDPAVALLHQNTPPNLHALVTFLCPFLIGSLGDLPLGKFRKAGKNAESDAEPWPNNQSDVIANPGGAKATVSALLTWVASPADGCHPVFSLLGEMARFWEPFARELFRTPLAFSLATNYLQFIVDRYDPRAEYLVTMEHFSLPLLMCADGFFFTLSVRDPKATLIALDPVFDQMARITVKIRPMLKADLIRNNQSPLPSRSPRDGPTFAVMFSQIVYIRNLNQCMHLDCPKPLGVKISVCTRCGIVCYCDAQCQRPAWRAPSFPHKRVCDMLHSLRVALQLEKIADWESWVIRAKDTVIAPGRQTVDFDTLCKAKQVNQELSVLICDEVFGLTDAKRAQLDKKEQ